MRIILFYSFFFFLGGGDGPGGFLFKGYFLEQDQATKEHPKEAYKCLLD